MKLKFNVHCSGPDHTWEVGQTYEITDQAEAKRLIAAGYAAPAGKEKAVARTAVEKRAGD